MEQIENIEILNPNRAWVISEFEKLYSQWQSWKQEVDAIVDQPYDRNTHSDVFADGTDMMLRHDVLQAKTLSFLNNNVRGHGFIRGFDGHHVDRTDLRLKVRVEHRMRNLEMLRATLIAGYARSGKKETERGHEGMKYSEFIADLEQQLSVARSLADSSATHENPQFRK